MGSKSMRIECYLSPECPTEEGLRENIASALSAEKVEGEVSLQRIDDDEAIALRLSGSPSVFINGRELQPQEAVGFS